VKNVRYSPNRAGTLCRRWWAIRSTPVFRAFPKTIPHAPAWDAALDGLIAFVAFASASALVHDMYGAQASTAWIDDLAYPLAVSVAALMIAVQVGVGTYNKHHDASEVLIRYAGCIAAVAIGVPCAFTFLGPTERRHLYTLSGIGIGMLFIAELILRGAAALVHARAGVPRMVIVGAGLSAAEVFSSVRSDGRRAREVVGFYRTLSDQPQLEMGAPVFDYTRELADIVCKFAVQEIVVATTANNDGPGLERQLSACRQLGLKVLTLAEFHDRQSSERLNEASVMDHPLGARIRCACSRYGHRFGLRRLFGRAAMSHR